MIDAYDIRRIGASLPNFILNLLSKISPNERSSPLKYYWTLATVIYIIQSL